MKPPVFRPSLLLVALLGAASASHATTFIISQSASCPSGSCEFVPDVTGPGAATSILRTYEDPPQNPGSLLMQNQAAMTVVGYGGFSASVSTTEALQDYPVGTQGTVGPNLSALAKATIWDVVTVSGSSGPGTLRMMWHLTGGVDVGWSLSAGAPVEDIDHAQVNLNFGCFAQQVGTTIPDSCPDPVLTWNAPAAVDQIVNIDMPIVFGAPVQFILTISLQSAAGTGYYTASTGLISLSAHALGGFGSTGTLVDTEVLDSFGQPVSGSTIQSESGFQYDIGAPEPGGALLAAVGSLVLAVARYRRLGPPSGE